MAEQNEAPRGIDFEKMEAALKRAGYKAIHGTREGRSGRFLRAEKPHGALLESKWTKAKADQGGEPAP